jgi:hypothetical protein
MVTLQLDRIYGTTWASTMLQQETINMFILVSLSQEVVEHYRVVRIMYRILEPPDINMAVGQLVRLEKRMLS